MASTNKVDFELATDYTVTAVHVSSPHLPIDISLLLFYEYSDMTSSYVHSGSEWPNSNPDNTIILFHDIQIFIPIRLIPPSVNRQDQTNAAFTTWSTRFYDGFLYLSLLAIYRVFFFLEISEPLATRLHGSSFSLFYFCFESNDRYSE